MRQDPQGSRQPWLRAAAPKSPPRKLWLVAFDKGSWQAKAPGDIEHQGAFVSLTEDGRMGQLRSSY